MAKSTQKKTAKKSAPETAETVSNEPNANENQQDNAVDQQNETPQSKDRARTFTARLVSVQKKISPKDLTGYGVMRAAVKLGNNTPEMTITVFSDHWDDKLLDLSEGDILSIDGNLRNGSIGTTRTPILKSEKSYTYKGKLVSANFSETRTGNDYAKTVVEVKDGNRVGMAFPKAAVDTLKTMVPGTTFRFMCNHDEGTNGEGRSVSSLKIFKIFEDSIEVPAAA